MYAHCVITNDGSVYSDVRAWAFQNAKHLQSMFPASHISANRRYLVPFLASVNPMGAPTRRLVSKTASLSAELSAYW